MDYKSGVVDFEQALFIFLERARRYRNEDVGTDAPDWFLFFPLLYNWNFLEITSDTYDYIIVGGGLTGLVVANRLTEDPDMTVLVVEYGYIDNSSTTLVPFFANGLNINDMFDIISAPIPDIANQTFPVWVGSVVGGGSLVNGMEYDRASAPEYDSWKALGNPGWGWSDLFPYFKKSTNFTAPLPAVAEEYGYTWNSSSFGEGPIQVSYPPYQYPDLSSFWAGMRELNLTILQEGADGVATGVFWTQSSLDPKSETRSSSRTAYYDNITTRPNLNLITGHQARTITISNRTATAVTIINRMDNSTSSLRASKEVVMAAGSIHTPQILQLSGIGPKSVLEAASVDVLLDLPAVGANFQDHPVAYLDFNLTRETFPNPNTLSENVTFNASAYQRYLADKSGPWTIAHGNSAAWLPLETLTPNNVSALITDLRQQNASAYLPPAYRDKALMTGFLKQRDILSKQIEAGDTAVYELPFNGGGSVPNAIQKPLSRGTVYINASNPTGEPVVTFNTFQNPFDAAVLFASVNYTRTIFKTSALSELGPVELVPGTEAQDEQAVIAALTASGSLAPSFAHPSGTCAMMPKELGGCVGPDLLVYGMERLSVIDASIIPLIPAAHLQATMYAIAEKAADIIKVRGNTMT
ncbi:MAG: hypothetical protein M1820_007527 [Bogoriella megaspora]|nr:MAG: hypothetical protein M1820_007527 [Bogoriella megaspora]